jgi:uncharacterized protein (DUF1778 family)
MNMASVGKAEHLHLRTIEREKAMLTMAARARNLSVSQFLLQTSLPVAERIVEEDAHRIQTVFKLNDAEWQEFNRLLDAPPRDIPELRKLLNSQPPWEE